MHTVVPFVHYVYLCTKVGEGEGVKLHIRKINYNPFTAPSPPSAPQNPVLMLDAMFYQPGSKTFAGILQADDIKGNNTESLTSSMRLKETQHY